MTESEQHQAELDRIDAERKKKEDLLFILLLGFVSQARVVTNGSVRGGHRPMEAIRRVFTGNGTPHFPGAAPKIANGLADIDLAARAEVNRQAVDALTVAEPRVIPLPVLPPKVEVARSYRAFASQTVADMENNVSALVSDVLARAKDAGASINTIITTMREAFAAKGYAPGTAARLKNQAITMAAQAWASGSYAGFRSPGVWEAIRAFKFLVVHNDKGEPDGKVCPICRPLDGLTLPRDDPRWASLWTPRHFVCRCLVLPVFGNFKPSTVPNDLPPASPNFGTRPDLSPGFTAFGTN